MRRRLLLCGLGAVVAVLGLGLSVRPPDAGVQVTIQNQGPGPLHEVVVHVTGDSYQVGDIGIGESRTVAVQSHGESHVEIESALEDGRRSPSGRLLFRIESLSRRHRCRFRKRNDSTHRQPRSKFDLVAVADKPKPAPDSRAQRHFTLRASAASGCIWSCS